MKAVKRKFDSIRFCVSIGDRDFYFNNFDCLYEFYSLCLELNIHCLLGFYDYTGLYHSIQIDF